MSVRDELACLRDRELGRTLGACDMCGKPVRSQQDLVRRDGAMVHLRCWTRKRSG